MKQFKILLVLVAIFVLAIAGCSKRDNPVAPTEEPQAVETEEVLGTLTVFFAGDADSAQYELINVNGKIVSEGTVKKNKSVIFDSLGSGAVFSAWNDDNSFLSEPVMFTDDTTSRSLRVWLESDTVKYHLEIVNGSIDGNYPAGSTVNIYSDDPQTGWHFVNWTGDVVFADPSARNTTIVMPEHDLTVTANYEENALVPYIKEDLVWNQNTESDIFILKTNIAGTNSNQITFMVLNGTTGPMLAINLYTGEVYKFNGSAYYSGFSVVVVRFNDQFQINLGQEDIRDYKYSRVTYIYGQNIVDSQWHYDGRCNYPEPELLTDRIQDEVNGQWDHLSRQ